MKRTDFLKTVIRYVLLAFLMLISFVLGRKVVYGSDCSSCPEYAGCNRLITCSSPPSVTQRTTEEAQRTTEFYKSRN